MDLSTAMRFVMVRAHAEALACEGSEIYPEHIFLGILKLSELSAEEIAPTSRHKEQTDKDIEIINTLLKNAGLASSDGRYKLRRALKAQQPSGSASDSVAELFKAAAATGCDVLTATDVLMILLNEPTPLLKEVLPIGEPKPIREPSPNANSQDSLSFLAELTCRVGHMRLVLLDKVHGQDHVIHSFAEGIFNAEVLAKADETRKRPKAIFVFAGPPGVGKTFLAEQAAEALSMPFKRFDMSSFADHQAHSNLIGSMPVYKGAKQGLLTGYVKSAPQCLLLFDEIEKAHRNTIQLFLQILDAGHLQDDFLDEQISFQDTIIIFTTNAGRQLYEGKHGMNAAGLPRQVILNALERDKDSRTGASFFPAAICSRLATGYPMLFNHLQAYDLEKIIAEELTRLSALFEKQYALKVFTDKLLASTILFSEGSRTDARTLRAQTDLFFKTELLRLCRLWEHPNIYTALSQLDAIRFTVETDALLEDAERLFRAPEKQKLLFFGDASTAERIRRNMPEYIIYNTLDVAEGLNLAGEHDLSLALLELAGIGTTRTGTVCAFDNVPAAAASFQTSRAFFTALRERLPEVPVYLVESNKFKIDNELLAEFVRAGARGKTYLPEEDMGVFVENLEHTCAQLYQQSCAVNLAAERKALSFETAPILSANRREAAIRLRGFALRRAVRAEDGDNVLAEAEKPNIKFDDVIGADDAKNELRFFVDFLKNPRKFSAQGLKPPKGVLLYGPPGTGKTLLAKAMAGESEAAFLPTAASGFVTKYQGSGPEAIRTLFIRARQYAPAIIFIDEIDAIGRTRNAGNSGHGEEMALNALLTEMDGFAVDMKRPVFVLAATNFALKEGPESIGVIDPALTRRFDRQILVDLPNKNDRRRYMEIKFGRRTDHGVTAKMIERLAGRSTGLSLAHLESVLEQAWRMALKKNCLLDDELLEEAFEISVHGEQKNWGHDYLERVARHEAGHAYLSQVSGNAPAYLTIVARGKHGGYMEHSAEEDTPLKTKEELLGRIRTALGGRAAEIIYYGDKDGLSSGASGDLQNATRIARSLICNYGMDDVIGMVALSYEEAVKGPLAEKITLRISEILKEEMTQTMQTLSKGKNKLDRLVERLLEKNKLTKEEIESILG